jgi:hypothetical protein
MAKMYYSMSETLRSELPEAELKGLVREGKSASSAMRAS